MKKQPMERPSVAELETELTKAMNAGNEISVETEEPKASGKNADGAKE